MADIANAVWIIGCSVLVFVIIGLFTCFAFIGILHLARHASRSVARASAWTMHETERVAGRAVSLARQSNRLVREVMHIVSALSGREKRALAIRLRDIRYADKFVPAPTSGNLTIGLADGVNEAYASPHATTTTKPVLTRAYRRLVETGWVPALASIRRKPYKLSCHWSEDHL